MKKKDDGSLIRISKFLSRVLRHSPESIGIKLDSHGWVNVEILLIKMKNKNMVVSKGLLHSVVESNDKQRFSFNDHGDKIRANQGHSISIDLGYVKKNPPKKLYHGTARRFLPSILQNGIKKQQRHHVHLSTDIDTAKNVGSRHGTAVVLEVDTVKILNNGGAFFQSANGVWLTEFVPTDSFSVFQK